MIHDQAVLGIVIIIYNSEKSTLLDCLRPAPRQRFIAGSGANMSLRPVFKDLAGTREPSQRTLLVDNSSWGNSQVGKGAVVSFNSRNVQVAPAQVSNAYRLIKFVTLAY